MEPFRIHTGVVAPLDRPNVDTDQIIPKQFLKRIERTGFGEFLFYDWRYTTAGEPDAGFVLNEQGYAARASSSRAATSAAARRASTRRGRSWITASAPSSRPRSPTSS